MNADIPYLKCWVRMPFISRQEGMEEAYAFGISSFPGRALGFHVMLQSGAHYRHVPIHALALAEGAPQRQLGDSQLWDCFSWRPEVHVFAYLRDHECIAHMRSGDEDGTYLLTIDWLPDSWVHPGWVMQPDQNKCGHLIALDDGNLALLPTNRISWRDAYFCGRFPNPRVRGYTVQDAVYQAEDSAWDVSRDTDMYYDGASFSGSLAPSKKSKQRQPKKTPAYAGAARPHKGK